MFEQAPRDGEGQGGLACCGPWGHKESDMADPPNNSNQGFLPQFPWLHPNFLLLNWGEWSSQFTRLKCRIVGDELPLHFLPPLQHHLILMLNFSALRLWRQGDGRLGERHMIVMTDVWDESQYHKQIHRDTPSGASFIWGISKPWTNGN